jgi:uncharacterized protein with GYD domain
MVRYLSLLSFTDQGMANIQESTTRAANFRRSIEAAGGRVVSQYWALGEVDGCVVFEVSDDSVALAKLLALGKLGNVRTRSLRVYDEKEFAQVVARSN